MEGGLHGFSAVTGSGFSPSSALPDSGDRVSPGEGLAFCEKGLRLRRSSAYPSTAWKMAPATFHGGAQTPFPASCVRILQALLRSTRLLGGDGRMLYWTSLATGRDGGEDGRGKRYRCAAMRKRGRRGEADGAILILRGQIAGRLTQQLWCSPSGGCERHAGRWCQGWGAVYAMAHDHVFSC